MDVVKNKYISPSKYLYAWNNAITSIENAEKVVNDPRNPTMRKALPVESNHSEPMSHPTNAPAARQPATFTQNTAQAEDMKCDASETSANRETAPAIPPTPTSTIVLSTLNVSHRIKNLFYFLPYLMPDLTPAVKTANYPLKCCPRTILLRVRLYTGASYDSSEDVNGGVPMTSVVSGTSIVKLLSGTD